MLPPSTQNPVMHSAKNKPDAESASTMGAYPFHERLATDSAPPVVEVVLSSSEGEHDSELSLPDTKVRRASLRPMARVRAAIAHVARIATLNRPSLPRP